MTASLGYSTEALHRLIESCREGHAGFRDAAELANNAALKTLFGIYAQQRSRFAEELRSFDSDNPAANPTPSLSNAAKPFSTDTDLVNECLENEKRTLALYREVLAERALPTKAHFLVSAQLALMERVHNRIETLRPSEKPFRGGANHGRATA